MHLAQKKIRETLEKVFRKVNQAQEYAAITVTRLINTCKRPRERKDLKFRFEIRVTAFQRSKAHFCES